jgi:DNA processing protein
MTQPSHRPKGFSSQSVEVGDGLNGELVLDAKVRVQCFTNLRRFTQAVSDSLVRGMNQSSNVGEPRYLLCMGTVKDQELIYLIAMLGDPGSKFSPFDLRSQISEMGGVTNVWESQGEASLFVDELQEELLRRSAIQLDLWKRKGYLVTSYLDERYPEQLRSIHEMPLVVWTKGKLIPDKHAVSIVGTRNPDKWALQYVDALVDGLTTQNVTVVSGLAEGIDTRAHQAALERDLRTVAILGNGLETAYPTSNASLQQQIVNSGLLLTQFRPDFKPTRYSFPMRNATMSGYSNASVIIQAGENSGTRIQGRVAVGHGRCVILSHQVATSTNWGAALQEKPGVFVARDVEDAIELALRYSTRIPTELSALLH